MQEINIAGIVCEYNPFHMGHAYMINQLRSQGCRAVVCVMSGGYVQRAEPALLPAHTRARAAIAGGADLVLRLPLPWAAASAESFAAGSVGILAALGCVDTLAFGAENANAGMLENMAILLRSNEFAAELKRQLEKGVSFAGARAAAADILEPGAGALLARPNNILGIEYCKALQGPLQLEFVLGHLARGEGGLAPEQRAGIENAYREGNAIGFIGDEGYPTPAYPRPYAIPRQGAGHDAPPAGGYASASWLRQQVYAGPQQPGTGPAAAQGAAGIETLAGYVPDPCLAIYREAAARGRLLDPERWQLALLARLKGLAAGEIALSPGAGEGLENRLAAAARQAVDLEGLYNAVKSKRYAHSRIRRLALGAALGLQPQHTAGVMPPYIQVLAANQTGLGVLKQAKRTTLRPIGTSLAKLAKTGREAAEAVRLEAAAEDLYALCQQTPRPGGESFTQPAAIIKA